MARARRARQGSGIAAAALLASASAGFARDYSDLTVPVAAGEVPVATIVNTLKCDYLDFAYSDYARARRLAVGKVTGSVSLALSRRGTDGVAVAVAPQPIRVDRDHVRGAAKADNALTIPFAMDPQLALDPARSGLDCSPAARLAQPVLPFTALAAEIARASQGAPYFTMRSPIRWQGQFYLLRRGGATEVALVKVDPARVATDGIYLHAFDLAIETGAPSWFADVGPATAEPREEPAPAPRPGSRVLRVPQAPVRARAAVPVRERQCVGPNVSEIVCY